MEEEEEEQQQEEEEEQGSGYLRSRCPSLLAVALKPLTANLPASRPGRDRERCTERDRDKVGERPRH